MEVRWFEKKSEVTAAPTASLILWLARAAQLERLRVKDVKMAEWICEELELREAISDADELLAAWKRL